MQIHVQDVRKPKPISSLRRPDRAMKNLVINLPPAAILDHSLDDRFDELDQRSARNDELRVGFSSLNQKEVCKA
jgi:hypothetical protein